MSSIAASAWTGGTNVDADGKSIAGTGWGGAGKYANSSTGMIAFGTVVGGASAELTGGNFWMGAASGFMVSYLNHSFHTNESMEDQLNRHNKPVDGVEFSDQVPEENIDGVNKVLRSSPELQRLNRLAHHPQFSIKANVNNADAGYTEPTGRIIELYGPAFTSNLELAYTMGHEYGHAYDFTSGQMGRWMSKHTISWNMAKNISEIKSYRWEMQWGNYAARIMGGGGYLSILHNIPGNPIHDYDKP